MDLMKTPVSKFMTKKVISAQQEDTLKKVLELMDKHGILGLPVVDGEGLLVGIITESDLIKPFSKLKSPFALTLLGSVVYLENPQNFNDELKEHCARQVKDLMEEEVVFVSEKTTLSEVIELMSRHKISRLPVTDSSEKLVGIVTRSDVVHQMAKDKTL